MIPQIETASLSSGTKQTNKHFFFLSLSLSLSFYANTTDSWPYTLPGCEWPMATLYKVRLYVSYEVFLSLGHLASSNNTRRTIGKKKHHIISSKYSNKSSKTHKYWFKQMRTNQAPPPQQLPGNPTNAGMADSLPDVLGFFLGES